MALAGKEAASGGKRTPESHGRLLSAGIDIFGEFGFAAATTRMIAERAGANIAAIPYYFGGKEGLYRAVVEHIADRVNGHIGPILQEIKLRTAGDSLVPPEALDLLERLLGKVIDFMVGSPEAARFVRIVLREQLQPSSAYDIIFERIMNPILGAVSAMTAAAAGRPPSRDTSLRAMAIVGQVIAFRVARETAVRRLKLVGYSPEETDEIRQVILNHTRAVVRAMSAGTAHDAAHDRHGRDRHIRRETPQEGNSKR